MKSPGSHNKNTGRRKRKTGGSTPPVILVCGPSGSGKTSLIEKVVRNLTKRGYRVGTVKHTAHGYHLDKKGKDSWRHSRAGAEKVVLTGPRSHVLMVRGTSRQLDKLAARYLNDLDIVIAEGYRKEKTPRITFSGPSSKIHFRYRCGVKWSSKKFERHEIKLLSDFVEAQFLKTPSPFPLPSGERIKVRGG
ncbi:MAG: molybdopterin-guanine dinucleotide biosynthesis protein B [Candidatus Eisenbacteria bacterium]|nr:molybdopterin-guanine dinucleotide biosynthesis protein B [Candidatus Eisenbacteria bacterium]